MKTVSTARIGTHATPTLVLVKRGAPRRDEQWRQVGRKHANGDPMTDRQAGFCDGLEDAHTGVAVRIPADKTATRKADRKLNAADRKRCKDYREGYAAAWRFALSIHGAA